MTYRKPCSWPWRGPEAWQDDKLMGPELRTLGEFQLELWPGLWCLQAVLLGGGSGVELPACKGLWMPTLMGALAQVAQQSQGRCWALVVTPGNDGLSLCFSVCRRGRAQLPARSGCGRHCPGSCPGADVRSVLCGFWFGFVHFCSCFLFLSHHLPCPPALHASTACASL